MPSTKCFVYIVNIVEKGIITSTLWMRKLRYKSHLSKLKCESSSRVWLLIVLTWAGAVLPYCAIGLDWGDGKSASQQHTSAYTHTYAYIHRHSTYNGLPRQRAQGITSLLFLQTWKQARWHVGCQWRAWCAEEKQPRKDSLQRLSWRGRCGPPWPPRGSSALLVQLSTLQTSAVTLLWSGEQSDPVPPAACGWERACPTRRWEGPGRCTSIVCTNAGSKVNICLTGCKVSLCMLGVRLLKNVLSLFL